MKKVVLLFVIVMAIGFTSCKKDYCASCTESNTGTPTTFCGPEDEVDAFIDELKTTGALYGQTWNCTKQKD